MADARRFLATHADRRVGIASPGTDFNWPGGRLLDAVAARALSEFLRGF
ncbi:MAG: hypothetical protein M3304_11610 [Actinomycetota bacterium]|nr:hypothetical protein [Actinomycetota bacterium]